MRVLMFTKGDKDVTSLYDVKNENGIVTATRKDASSAPGGISLSESQLET